MDSNEALRLMVNFGMCKISNTLPENYDLWDVALVAAKAYKLELIELHADALALNQQFETIKEPIEFSDYVYDLLSLRQDGWAVCVALGEVYESASCKDHESLGIILDSIYDMLNKIDKILLEKKHLLICLNETEFFNNSRRMIAAPYNDPLPWWLDGCLELCLGE